MKKPFILIVLTFALTIFSQQQNLPTQNQKEGEDKILELKRDIDKINDKVLNLQTNIENQEKLTDRTSNSISNQLSATSVNISIFGILFGIAAIGLGVYVTRIERKIVLLKDDNKLLLDQTKLAKEEVVKINEQIQKDIYGLFLKIKREETVHILNRLTKVPEDIANLLEQLLSRDLENDDFFTLKEAYLKLKDKKSEEDEVLAPGAFPLANTRLSYLDSYKILFFQHFLYLTVKDKSLNDDIIDNYKNYVESAFENDIIKSTQDFMNGIMEMGYRTKEDEIKAFVKAISTSSFKMFEPVYQIMFNTLKTKDNQFNFYNIINVESADLKIAKSKFGQILIDSYSTTATTSEAKVLEKIAELTAEVNKEVAQQKEEKEQKKKAREAKKS